MQCTTALKIAGFAILAARPSPACALGGGETAKLVPADGEALDLFGSSVAMSGFVTILGSPYDDDNGDASGSAYLFDASTGLELAKLVPLDGDADDLFGNAVAIDGNRAVVGAFHDENGGGSGSAYLFDTGTLQQVAKLLPSHTTVIHGFGRAVAIHGSTLIVGATTDAFGPDPGSAYLFDLATGQQTARLEPNDVTMDAHFGHSVALVGTTAVVGAFNDWNGGSEQGAAYVFDTTTGRQLQKLLPGDPADGFGASVAIEGALVLVGAPYDDDGELGSGSVFGFAADSGLQLLKLRANDAYYGDNFGGSIAIDGGIVLIGARGENSAAINAGAAYLFDAGTGQQIAKRFASDGGEEDRLGNDVEIRGGLAVAGASFSSSSGLWSGSAYVFATDEAIAVPYCFGTSGDRACPCMNFGTVGHGCANSAFPEGARLFGDRAPCVLGDDFTLWVWNSTPLQPGLFFQGDDALDGGAGIPFGDGLRCAGTHVIRLEVDAANMSGRSHTTIPIAETAGIVAGDVKRYQWWYRDPNGGPCGTGFNLSNGLEVTWAP